MSECSVYIPTIDPDKRLGSDNPLTLGIPATSVNRSIYLTWTIPTGFITVDPELSFCWVSLNEDPVKVDWLLEYQYLNKESYMGYFDKGGMPVISFDDGRSELHTAILKADINAEKDIIQVTPSHPFIKNGRQSGTFVVMEVEAQPQPDDVFFMGAHIKYTEAPRVIEPMGRKRTRKRRWYDEEPYPYG